MAHGRVQTPAATSPPVLTGFPVSGCCYLDRPDPAGYFLFPDLSVRHEGRYHLVFSLYELIKEDQDQDRDAPPHDQDAGMSDFSAGNANHRMDLRSTPFMVYSAKKFPGLTESTTLSRTVAEQGCRVRIRRDVRMRRRDTKASAASEYENNVEDEYARRNRTQTPEAYRARSVSNSSMDRTPYGSDRRPSNAEYGAPPPPPLYQGAQPPSSMLNFGHGSNPGFAQPYAPSHSSQSTPVSPAQPIFPSNANFPPPPPSPSYPPPNYSHYDSPASAGGQDIKRRSSASNYPAITAKPTAPYPPPQAPARSSIGSIGPISLPSIIASPKISPRHPHEQLAPMPPITRSSYSQPPTYHPPDSRPGKRSIDALTPVHQDGRNVNRQRPSDGYHDDEDDRNRYRRADGLWVAAQFPSYE
ncbi:velvet factor-domain-containing protein [Whalleya microplaca]|nr:velvet factor-domain-containing protein [Whalleya microplaca]